MLTVRTKFAEVGVYTLYIQAETFSGLFGYKEVNIHFELLPE